MYNGVSKENLSSLISITTNELNVNLQAMVPYHHFGGGGGGSISEVQKRHIQQQLYNTHKRHYDCEE